MYRRFSLLLFLAMNLSVAARAQEAENSPLPTPPELPSLDSDSLDQPAVKDVLDSDESYSPTRRVVENLSDAIDANPLTSNLVESNAFGDTPPGEPLIEEPRAPLADDEIETIMKVLMGENPEDWPSDSVNIPAANTGIAIRPDGSKVNVPYERFGTTVDPQAGNLSHRQRHAIYVSMIEAKLRSVSDSLMKAEDDDKEKLLSELEKLLTKRYKIDTAIQEFLVREIEARARALRNDVEARKESCDKWTEAMVTLARMRSSGIETMFPGRPGQPPIQPSLPGMRTQSDHWMPNNNSEQQLRGANFNDAWNQPRQSANQMIQPHQIGNDPNRRTASFSNPANQNAAGLRPTERPPVQATGQLFQPANTASTNQNTSPRLPNDPRARSASQFGPSAITPAKPQQSVRPGQGPKL